MGQWEPGSGKVLYASNKGLLYHTWNSAKCYVAAWMGGEFGGEWISIDLSGKEYWCGVPAIVWGVE